MILFMRFVVWLGEIFNRVTCTVTRSHFPPPDRIDHLIKLGILADEEGIECIHCGKLLRGG